MEYNHCKASVIVPVYQAKPYLEKCLMYLLCQDMEQEEMEVILVDDGSDDGSSCICESYARKNPHVKFLSQPHAGASAARNLGIKEARGKYLLFVDADDFVSESYVREMVSFLEEHEEETELVASHETIFVDGKAQNNHIRYRDLTKTGIYDLQKTPYVLQDHINICVKNEPGLHFEEGRELLEGMELCARLLEKKGRIGYVKEAEYCFCHNTSCLGARLAGPVHTFEPSIALFEELFQSHGGQVPAYVQALFLYDFVEKFRQGVFWPYHYCEEKLAEAKERFHKLLERVDNDIIQAYPYTQSFERMYWLRLKGIEVEADISEKGVSLYSEGKLLYTRDSMEIILTRLRVEDGTVCLRGFIKSPLFAFGYTPKLYARINEEEQEIPCKECGAGYYRALEKTNAFFGFEMEIFVKESVSVQFSVDCTGVRFPVDFYNAGTVSLSEANTSCLAADIYITEKKEGELVLQKVDGEKRKQYLAKELQKIKDNGLREAVKVAVSSRENRIWLYMDGVTEARNNGWMQFLHDLEKDDGIQRYYIAASRDFVDPKVDESRIIFHGSQRHLELFLQSEKILASFADPAIVWPTGKERKQLYAFFHGQVIWLKHGVWHAHLPWQYSKYLSMADRVIVSSAWEKENFLRFYDYEEEELLLSGLSRFDGLEKGSRHTGKILYAPSWRSYLSSQELVEGFFGEENKIKSFRESDYVRGILALVQSPRLQSFLAEQGLTMELMLHPRFRKYQTIFENLGDRISFAENDADLNQYDMLVTDYSSILHDFAYMEKPVISYWTDKDDFASGRTHYRELEIVLSDWCCCTQEPEATIEVIISAAARDFALEEKYRQTYQASYGELSDNREKLYQALFEEKKEALVVLSPFERFKARFEGFDKEHVWMFDAGHQGRRDFRGNPKYLFVYVNRYRPDICAYWYCMADAEETIEQVRSLGFCGVLEGTPEAEYALERTGVIITEMLREYTPDFFLDKKYINLWHGVGFKRVERALSIADTGDLRLAMARKYIRLNAFYISNQLMVATSPIFEKEYMEDCGLERDHILRTGYLRCMYQKNYEPIHTFDADLLKQKGLPSDTVLAAYTPTYRAKRGNAFVSGLENLEKLHECCKRNHILLIFKVHPFMEKEKGFLHAWQRYRDYPNFWFWNNADDFYEIMDRIDLVIHDYSGIFSDFLCAGVKHYIRYVYDEEEYMAEGFTQGREAYEERTYGIKCHTFEELLHAIDHYQDFYNEKELQAIYQRLWSYAGDDDFEKTVQAVFDFKISEMKCPTLYSFDIFDTLISRKGLHPYSIFYAVRERMSQSQGFSADFIERYPRLRHFAEMNVREYYRRTTMNRDSVKTEIRFEEIFQRLQSVYGLTDAQVKLLMDWEIQEELTAVIPLTEQIDLLKKYHAEGNEVVLISDMYLPKNVVQEMLRRADPLLAELPLFLSNEYGVLKTTKWLYFEVYRSFRPFYYFGQWIHYGDTPNADQNPARWLGIQSRLVSKPSFSEMETELVNSLHNSDGYLSAAMQARLRQEYPGTQEEFVIDFVGLSMIPYVDWAVRDAMAKGFQTLYFVSRDGYFLKKIADALIAEHHWEIKTKYIYASRRTWRIPSYFDKIDDCFWLPQGGSFNDIHSKENLFRAMDLDEETFQRIYPYVDLEQVDWSGSQPGWELAPLLEPSEEYRDYLLARAAEERPIVCEYLRQEIDPNEKFAMVEYWGRGYNQECMARLWNHVVGEEVPCYYYYARTLYPTEGKCIRYNFTSSDVNLEFMESIFANMPYHTVESYERVEGEIRPVIVPLRHDKSLFDVMEQLLPEMARRYAALGLKDPEGTDRQLYDFLLWYFYNNKTSSILAPNLGRLRDSQSVAGKKREYAPAYTMEDIEGFREGIPRGRRTSSVTMSYLRASKDVQDAYAELYQREQGDNMAAGSKLSQGEIKSNKAYQKKCESLKSRALRAEMAYDHYCSKLQVFDTVCVVASEGELKGEVLWDLVPLLRKEESLSVVWVPADGPASDDEKMMRQLAVAKCIILRRNVEQFSGLRFRPETCVIRLVDRGFRLFRFGNIFLQKLRWRVRFEKMITNVQATAIEYTGTDTEIRGYNLNEGIVEKLPGACITDILFDEEFRQESLTKVRKFIPEIVQKKLIFYMPTPRMREKSKSWLELLDLERLAELLGEEYVLAVDFRSDKKVAGAGKNTIEIPGFSIDVTSLDVSPRNMLLAADVIIGDYRDTFFESSLLHKPVFSTASDARWMQEHHPNLLYDLPTMYPFPIVGSAEELAERLQHLDAYDYRPLEEFNGKYLQGCDGKASQRMVEYVKEVCGKKQDRYRVISEILWMEERMDISSAFHQTGNLKDFFAVLSQYKDRYLICAAVKDSISRIDDESAEILMDFGMEDLRPRKRCGYVFVMDRGKIILNESTKVNMAILRLMDVAGIELQIISKSYLAGNKASIVIDEYDLATNSRGLNVVVFDPKSRIAIDSVCFDFYPDSKMKKVMRPFFRNKDFLNVVLPHKNKGNRDAIFDIDEELDKIVEKYRLDKYYPNYINVKKAKKAIRNLANTWKPEENILCIIAIKKGGTGTGNIDKLKFLENLTQIQSEQINFAIYQLEIPSRPPLNQYTWDVFDEQVLEKNNLNAYQRIYIISNYGSNFVKYWLRRKVVNYVCLADYLLQYDIINTGMEYYQYVPDKRENCFFRWDETASSAQWALYEESELYNLYQDVNMRIILAKKCFFLALSMKNFLEAKEWLDRILLLDKNEDHYSKAWNAIEALLAKIKRLLDNRQKHDILAFWVDATGYNDVFKDMPFISSLQDKGIWFKSMIGVAGFTRETLRGVFAEETVVDDMSHKIKKINFANSPLLRMLIENDYRIRLSGDDPRSFFADQFITKKDCMLFLPVSEKLWYTLNEIISSDKPVFSMVFIDDGHKPYLSCKINDASVADSLLRKTAAHKEVDAQLKFYFEIIGKKATTITFCDHGDDDFWPREHVFFSITGKKYSPRSVSGVYSLIDFKKIIEHILKYNNIHEDEIKRDYAEIQAVAVVSRNRKFLDTSETMEEASPGFMPIFRGYRGVVTEDYVYIHFAGGREWLSRRDHVQPALSWYVRPDDICDVSLLPRMREMAKVDYGNEPPEYGERIPYYFALQEQYETNLPYNMRKVVLANELVEQFPDSTVAINSGDKASYEWFLMLSLENRKKIVCVLDENPNCICASLGIPVKKLSALDKSICQYIIVTSRKEDSVLNEAVTRCDVPLHVYGFYGWMEAQGYYTEHNFWDFAIQKWDRKPSYPHEIQNFLHQASPKGMEKISVIVVTQNDEDRIAKSLCSLVKQTAIGEKIYCLDLGSTDKTISIIEAYSSVDFSIQLEAVRQEDLVNRINKLLDSMEQKYVMFLSPCEFLHSKALDCLFQAAEQSRADVVASSSFFSDSQEGKDILSVWGEGEESIHWEAKLLEHTQQARCSEWMEKDSKGFCGARLYRSEFLRQRQLYFVDLFAGAIDIFVLQAVLWSEKYVQINNPVCIRSSQKVSRRIYSVAQAKNLVHAMFRYQQFIDAIILKLNLFRDNTVMQEKIRNLAMKIFEHQYLCDEDMRKDGSDMKLAMEEALRQEIQENPSVKVWWIQYLFHNWIK